MKTKVALFQKRMLPITNGLKASIAASVGRTIIRHSYLQWIQAKIIHYLLEISIKQGRLAVKVPRPHLYTGLVQDLLEFHKIGIQFNFSRLKTKLDAADKARNTLAHSVFMQDGQNTYIQIVSGSWEFPQDVMPVKRALTPETPLVGRAFLNEKRKEVEDAIKSALELQRTVRHALDTLHEKRRTENVLNRRRQDRN